MNKKFANLQLHQMDLALTKLRDAHPPSRPVNGWVKAIRESLGMSASALARKLGVTPHSIAKLEKAEADEKSSKKTTKKSSKKTSCSKLKSLIRN